MNIYLLIGFLALLWGGWPLVAKLANEHPLNSLIMMMTASIPVLVVAVVTGGMTLSPLPSFKPLFAAGLMIGGGMMVFATVLASPTVDVTVSVPIINTAMMLVTVIGGVIAFNEGMPPQKIMGIGVLMAGIIMVGRAA